MPQAGEPEPLCVRRAWVIVASTRAAHGIYPDRTGPIIADWLSRHSFEVENIHVVADGVGVGRSIRSAIAASADLVLTTGGTGLSPTDQTPEQTRPLLDREIPGLADAIRAAGGPTIPTAMLSRGLAGACGQSLIVNLPGSTGGVTDGLAVLETVIDHALDQLAGGDHR